MAINGISRASILALAAATVLGGLSGRLWAVVDSPETTWQNSSTDWAAPGNWSAGVPSTANSAVFSGATTVQPTLTGSSASQGIWDTGTSGESTTTISGAFGLTITGSATLDGVTMVGILLDGAGNNSLTIDSSVTNLTNTNSTSYLVNNGGTLTINSALTITANKVLTLAGSDPTGSIVINGNIALTTGALTLNAAGNITLAGTNSYSGTTTIGAGTGGTAGGTVTVTNKDSLGTGLIDLYSGGFTTNRETLQASTDLTGSNAIHNALNIGQGSGTNVDRSATVGGNHSIEFSGAVNAPTTDTLENNIVTGKTLTLSGTLTLPNVLTIVGPGDTLISGVVSGVDSITYGGSGSLTITGNSNSFGGITIGGSGNGPTANGTVILGSDAAAGSGSIRMYSAKTITGFTLTLEANKTVTLSNPVVMGIGSGGAVDIAVVGGSNDMIFTGAVTMPGNSITLINNMVHAATLTYSGNTFTLSSNGTNPFTFSGSGNTTVSDVIAAATAIGFTQSGTGTLTLSGANTNTGTTTAGNGTLLLDINAGGSLNGSTGTALTLSGGNFAVKAASSGASSQTMTTFTVSGNTSSEITLDPNNGSGLTLTLGNAWVRGAGGTVLFDYSSADTGTRTANTAGATTGVGLTGGIYGFALVKDSTGAVGFATRDSSGNISRYDDTTGTTLAANSNSATTNFTTLGTTYTAGNFSWTGVTTRAVNSLTIDTTTNFGVLNLGATSNVLTLTSLGILFKGPNDETVTGGQIGGSGSEVIVHQAGTGTLTINSPISATSGKLTTDGTGVIVLGANNVYTGNTNINGGTLRANDGAGLPSASLLNINNGIWETSADVTRTMGTVAGNIQIPTGVSGFSANGAPVNISIGGVGTETPLVWNTPSFNPVTLVLNGATATNTLNLKNALDLRGGTRTISVNSAAPNTTATISGVISNSLDGELVKAGVGVLGLSATNTLTSPITVAAGTLALTSAGSVNMSSGITVNGPGAAFLNNSSVPVTAPITITSGTIGGSGTISAAGGINIAANAVISPGNSPAAQPYTTGVTFANGGTYKWELNAAGGSAGTNYDQIDAQGGSGLTITATGAAFTIDITSLKTDNTPGDVADFDNTHSYAWLIASNSALTGYNASDFTLSTANFTNDLGAGTFALHLGSDLGTGFTLDGHSNDLYLTFTGGAPVPEPASLALLGLGAASLLLRRRAK